MKLLALNILRWKDLPTDQDPVPECVLIDSHQSSVKEFVTFMSRVVAKRTQPGTRLQVVQNEYVCYVHGRTSGITGVLICDAEYPKRVAFSILDKALLEYESAHNGKWMDENCKTDLSLPYDGLDALLKKYQDPKEADNLMKIQKELEDIKTIMNQSLENILVRGEKLDSLVENSTDLSYQTKKFYTVAANQNSCCSIQ